MTNINKLDNARWVSYVNRFHRTVLNFVTNGEPYTNSYLKDKLRSYGSTKYANWERLGYFRDRQRRVNVKG
jgi:hypothetical protein